MVVWSLKDHTTVYMIKEYFCKFCNKKIEVIQKTEKQRKKKCPKCMNLGLEAVEFSVNSFQLRGGGWFKSGGY